MTIKNKVLFTIYYILYGEEADIKRCIIYAITKNF